MFPIFYAVIENDLRRVLAYSMINQIGFMVCGIGLGTTLAHQRRGQPRLQRRDLQGPPVHVDGRGAVPHRQDQRPRSSAGSTSRCRGPPGFCIVGAASISAFPLFSGFVSKSMVMVAALEQGHPIVWLVLLFASAGVLRACRHQDPLLRLLRPRFRHPHQGSAAQHAASPWASPRRSASSTAAIPGCSTTCCPSRSITRPSRPRTC